MAEENIDSGRVILETEKTENIKTELIWESAL